MTFKRKTPTIEAVQYDGTNVAEIDALLAVRSIAINYAFTVVGVYICVSDEGKVFALSPEELARLYEPEQTFTAYPEMKDIAERVL